MISMRRSERANEIYLVPTSREINIKRTEESRIDKLISTTLTMNVVICIT